MAIAAVLPVFLLPMFGITPSKEISPDYFQVKHHLTLFFSNLPQNKNKNI